MSSSYQLTFETSFSYFPKNSIETIEDMHSDVIVTLAICPRSQVCLLNVLSTLTWLQVTIFLGERSHQIPGTHLLTFLGNLGFFSLPPQI